MEVEEGAQARVVEAFGEMTFYEILGVQRNASDKEIKRAYRKMALKCHPDKCKDLNAVSRFQALGIVHSTLSDPEKRKTYDDTGIVCGGNAKDFKKWVDYWRKLFPKITVADIDKFEATYRYSAEERSDLLKAYTSFKGDMTQVFGAVMLSKKSEDMPRFVEIIESAIANEEVDAYPAFRSAAAKVAKKRANNGKSGRRKRKSKQADTALEELRAAIMMNRNQASSTALAAGSKTKRQREFDAMTDMLAAKYCSKKKKSGKSSKRRVRGPPSDAEFELLQKKMLSRKK